MTKKNYKCPKKLGSNMEKMDGIQIRYSADISYNIGIEEIEETAKRHGFCFEELNINQIRYSILKGISASIEDVRDQIILDAIRSAQPEA